MIDFPTMIQFESSTRCNARCSMCPRSQMSRPEGDMSDEIFERILKEGKELGVRSFLLFINGEPLAFLRFWQFMARIKEEGLTTTIFTNGYFLTPENIEEFKKYPNIDDFFISFHGGTKEAYERVMGLSWDTALPRIKEFVKEYPFPKLHVIMTEFEDNKGTTKDFKELWGDKGEIVHLWNYAGAREFEATRADLKVPIHPCPRLNTHIYVLWDGRVTTCCMDYDGVQIIGDMKKDSLVTIWHNAQALRDQYRQGDFSNLELCPKCNMNRF